MVLFTLATAYANPMSPGLEWSQIDMQNRIAWIHADQSKNEKVIRIPLNYDALSILRQQIGIHSTRESSHFAANQLKKSVQSHGVQR